MRMVAAVVVASTALAVATPSHQPGVPRAEPRSFAGWKLYDRLCLACHGEAGDGKGPAAPYTRGRPRAFVHGDFKWRSTPVGQPPSDDDLRAAIANGAPGTSMPGFPLGATELGELVEVVKAFEPTAFATAGKPIALGPARPRDPARGAYLWAQAGCDKCHGEHGHGDGPSAQPIAPFDLTTEPIRRPRDRDDLDARRRAIALDIATGLAGTSMPGFAGTLADADLWALADHVLDLGAATARRRREVLEASAIAADHTETGAWPGTGDEARVFGNPIVAQGPPPASLAPAEASLSSRQCGRCHAKQLREWQGAIHAAAATAGLRARELDGATGACDRCHAPLAEQRDDRELRAEGVTCAACHVRGWTRSGPRGVAPSLLGSPDYPLVELAIYERSDFCLPCHQLPARTAVAGKPLLDTYAEWLAGPYLPRGIQCQHCHMPNREHTWRGIHDRDAFREGIQLVARAHRTAGTVTVIAELRNIGAGHDLPTTATPAVWLRIELVDAHDRPIEGARAELRIGRDVWFDGKWHERADTRIPPGEQLAMARAWSAGRTGEATVARITVEVHPDAYYEHLYAQRLAGDAPAAARTLYEQALAHAKASHYIAEQHDVPIALSSR